MGRVLRAIPRYVVSYLLGIVTCVLVTPAELNLAGVGIWPLYPIFAVVGFFLFFFYLSPPYTFAPKLGHWLVVSIGLVPVVSEAAVYWAGTPGLRAWRPLWIGFPVGFVGTLGVYFTVAASI
jgi:hypothetical protein